jgi:hypothetical protein
MPLEIKQRSLSVTAKPNEDVEWIFFKRRNDPNNPKVKLASIQIFRLEVHRGLSPRFRASWDYPGSTWYALSEVMSMYANLASRAHLPGESSDFLRGVDQEWRSQQRLIDPNERGLPAEPLRIIYGGRLDSFEGDFLNSVLFKRRSDYTPHSFKSEVQHFFANLLGRHKLQESLLVESPFFTCSLPGGRLLPSRELIINGTRQITQEMLDLFTKTGLPCMADIAWVDGYLIRNRQHLPRTDLKILRSRISKQLKSLPTLAKRL